MISRLHDELRDLCKKKTRQIIITTHSPRFVTYEQAKQKNGTRLIMMTRPEVATIVHTNDVLTPVKIKPHLFNPEVFFGKCSMLVEGPLDFFVMKAISDFHDGLFGKCGIVLIHCEGKGNLPAFVDLHEKFQIPYYGMADRDYDGELKNITKLAGDLEDDLRGMGVQDVYSKANSNTIYSQVMNFLNSAADKQWKQTGIGSAFVKTIHKAGGSIPN